MERKDFNKKKTFGDRPSKDRAYDKERKDFKDRPFNKERRDFKDRPFNKERVSKFDRYHQDDSRKDNYKKNAYKEEEPKVEVVNERIMYHDNPDLLYDERVKVRCDFVSMSHDARGIAKVNGMTRRGFELTNYPIFVGGVLPGERADIEITTLKNSYAEGRLLGIRRTNKEDRVNPICPNYHNCGGCDLMHMSYEAQLRFKTQTVKDTLEHLGGITDIEVDPILGMEEPLHYRNKVQVPYHNHKGKVICGFFKKNSHEIVSLDTCFIQSTLASDIVKFVRNLANEYKIKGYDEDTHSGVIRHVMIRENKNQSEVMVVIVTKDKQVPFLNELVNKLVKRYPNITSVIQNVNSQKGNVVLGASNTVLFGNSSIKDELLGVYFNIGPMSFYQVNTKQTEKLYSKVIEKAELSKKDVLIDAYCGIGTIGLIASRHVKHVYGVEVVEEAIKNADINKELNNIENAEFVCAKAEDQIIKWATSKIKPTVIVVDPPRKGCDPVFLETVVKMKIKKMIYVSCNPATLARDLKYLKDYYDIKSVSPVDMFPNSNHVETVVLLELKK